MSCKNQGMNCGNTGPENKHRQCKPELSTGICWKSVPLSCKFQSYSISFGEYSSVNHENHPKGSGRHFSSTHHPYPGVYELQRPFVVGQPHQLSGSHGLSAQYLGIGFSDEGHKLRLSFTIHNRKWDNCCISGNYLLICTYHQLMCMYTEHGYAVIWRLKGAVKMHLCRSSRRSSGKE